MKAPIVAAAFVLIAAPLSGQVAGDSIRLRIRPSSTWNHGRFVAFDGTQLTLSSSDTNHLYQLQDIGKVEMRARKDPILTILGTTLGGVCGVGLAILTRPKDREPLFGNDGTMLAVAAGLGVVVGAIEVSVAPWQWRGVRLKAGT